MKIGSGKLRGRRIGAPAGRKTRPTSGRLRKALFDILAPRLQGARVLDLFAGAGSLGLEALSRGAHSVVFVERQRAAAEAIRKNAETLALSERAAVWRRDVRSALSALAGEEERFDVIFLDPPYRSALHAKSLERLGSLSLLRPGGIVVTEHHHKTVLADRYGRLVKHREVRAGESCLTFFREEEIGPDRAGSKTTASLGRRSPDGELGGRRRLC